MSTLVVNETLTVKRCGSCNITFALPEWLDKKRLADKKSWWCPNGCERVYAGKTELQETRDALAAETHRREQAEARVTDLCGQRDATERRLRATRGVVTRHKKKIAAGRCPCCSHQFKDLKAHMAKQHPAWNPEAEADACAAKEGAR